MSKWCKTIESIFKSKQSFELFLLSFFTRLLPSKWYLQRRFKLQAGYSLNLNNPRTFNEKLQWLKLYDHNPEYSRMVDKYEAKQYVADRIGDEHIIPTLAVYDRVDDIDFDKLPDQFVLKCTHDSGGLVICKEKSKLDRKAAKKKLSKSFHHKYYWDGREWPYKAVKPRIIAEQYIAEEDGELKDYKVFNFGGEPKIIQIDYNRFKGHQRNLYTADWKRIDATIEFPSDPQKEFEKPEVLNDLLAYARKLSKDIPHLRTDFYIINNHIYFGEMTFYHGSGMERISPVSFDVLMGEWIVLPKKD